MGHERIGEVFNFGVLHLEWPTALYIFVVFLITMFLLNTLLFKPILRTLESRKGLVDKNNKTIENLSSAIKVSKESFQNKYDKTQKEIHSIYQKGIEDSMKLAKSKIDQAKRTAEEKLNQARIEINKEKKDALANAKSLSEELAKNITTKTFN